MLHICRNFKHSQTVKAIRAHELRLMTALQWRLNAPNAFEVAETLLHLLLHFLKTENTTARCADAASPAPPFLPAAEATLREFMAVCLDVALYHEHFLRFPPSTVGLAAIMVRI